MKEDKEDIVIKYIEANTHTREQLETEIKNMEPGWKEFFDDNKGEIDEIFKKIGTAYYFPKREAVFRFCQDIALEDVKVVVVGMDPYNSYTIKNGTIVPDATGRSFEVQRFAHWTNLGCKSSLQNIFRVLYYIKTGEPKEYGEIRKKYSDKRKGLSEKDEDIGKFCSSKPSGWFNKTAGNGTLWLNASLTVEPNKAGSHKAKWKPFMKDLVVYMNEQNPNITWVLWGGDAKKLLEDFLTEIGVPEERKVATDNHPRKEEFFDEILEKEYWKLPPFTFPDR